MTDPRQDFRRVFTGRVARRSAIVAIVVGTALNAINQGPELITGQPPVWWKLALTYAVPFLVSSYGAWAALRAGD